MSSRLYVTYVFQNRSLTDLIVGPEISDDQKNENLSQSVEQRVTFFSFFIIYICHNQTYDTLLHLKYIIN